MAIGPKLLATFLEAIQFATLMHHGQQRRDSTGSPYVVHPIETAALLARVGVSNITTLTAAVLHDVVEDTKATLADIEHQFGSDVRALVAELTDDPKLPTAERRRRQLERTPGLSSDARAVKLADKVVNLRSLPVDWSRAQCEDYLGWAGRVGAALRGTHPELDSLFTETLERARMFVRSAPRTRLQPVSRQASVQPVLETEHELGKLFRVLRLRADQVDVIVDAIMQFEPWRTSQLGSTAADPAKGPAGRESPIRWLSEAQYKLLSQLAEPGVSSLQFRRFSHDVWASIGKTKWFRLSKSNAQLLAAIAMRGGKSTDGFVPFRRLRDLARRLRKSKGKGDAEHTITVGIGRLRQALYKQNHNPLLVETHRGGVRFRLRVAPDEAPIAPIKNLKPLHHRQTAQRGFRGVRPGSIRATSSEES
jgi:guanosine-3',5'-bis(diphosphate) 3'-pyrophosphohydrolase